MTALFSRRRASHALVLAGLLALSGCGRAPDDGASPPPSPPGPGADAAGVDARAERSWLGVLPCADCDGIQTRLSLHVEDGEQRYELEEIYLGGAEDNRFVQEGDWREEEVVIEGQATAVYRLDPDGPGRWFWPQPDGALEMLEAAGQPAADRIAYRLQRL